MKQSRLIFVLIAIFFVLNIFSCSQNNSNQNSTEVQKNTLKVGLITDLGGINDHSFNQLSYEGLKALNEENPNITISYLESKSFADYSLNVDTFVNEGYDLIIGVGATFIETIKEAAKNYPEQKFMINGVSIDENLPNVSCLVFANEEAGYLSGMAAALTTKTNTIGYIQGMALDSLNLFGSGYMEGARAINNDINILLYNTNNFADIAGGNVAATNMIKNGADIIYQVAGATGIGVINACADNRIYAIGSDSDQSVIAEDTVILSTIEFINRAVHDYIIDMTENGFKSGIIVKDLKSGMIDLTYNKKIFPVDIISKLNDAKNDIINGKIKISKNANEVPGFSFAN